MFGNGMYLLRRSFNISNTGVIPKNRIIGPLACFSCKRFHSSPIFHWNGGIIYNSNGIFYDSCTLGVCNWNQQREIRTRTIVSNFDYSHFVVSNPKTAGNWPPENDHGSPITREGCRKLMFELNQLEMERMEKMRKFNMPDLSLGDLVEVKYELSRTEQTFATFTGYCIKIRKRGLNSSFSLKNAFDGVGVTQLFPLYSPRILNVKIIKSLNKGSRVESRPITRDYRYKFHRNVRHRFAKKRGVHKPGIRSFEIRLKNRITRLKQSYYRMRLEAGLPPYIWGGPYNLSTRKRTRLVKGETYRRIQLYSLDEQRARAEKLSKRRRKSAWGNYRLPGTRYLQSLSKEEK